ncbi:hypothetical protein K469DRAFT_556602 [Zopfia rhizophila CBS 207.26]|uniref:PSI domain-containing protein n=1 Tax=Zopfia rhizophila CBS 207.26 TaxID=1314779 RepID=A0A6A6EL95_9PEZI|nr:hypothetical protein K469DRAFT_556602 [Zopfia rhizophila CBS 207.26]
MTSGCSSALSTPLFNVSELLMQRWQDSPKDDRKRLELCWGYQDCGDCHRSEGFCGWCAISSTCLPLPLDPLSRAFPLLSPVSHKGICALGPERFELRTGGLGCQVSTITFLTSVITIFCTIFGALILLGLVIAGKRVGLALKSRKGGWVVYGDGTGEVWVRKKESWAKWWRRVRGKPREDEELVGDEGMGERPRWLWWSWERSGTSGGSSEQERRALLG